MTIRKLVSLTVSIVALAFACSKQGEGERCVSSNLNQDCDDNLTCMKPPGNGSDACETPTASRYNCKPNRCCYAGQIPTDSRCVGYSTPAPVSATGGADAGVGGSSAAGASAGGSSSASTASTGGETGTGGSSATSGGEAATGGSTGAGGSSASGATATGGATSPSST
jgi:hypothetical protein